MENWLNPTALVSAATVFATVIGAMIAIAKERRAAPIDKKTVEMATTTAISTASKQAVETSTLLNERLENENKRVIEEARESRLKVALWEIWYNTMSEQWDIVRQNENPPDAPRSERPTE